MGKVIKIEEYLNKNKKYTNSDFAQMIGKLNEYGIKLEKLMNSKKYYKKADSALMDFHMSILENYFSLLLRLIKDEKNPLYNESMRDVENLIKLLTPIEEIKDENK